MEVTKMSDETKTVAVATAPAPAQPAAQTAAQPTMAQVMHDPNAPIMTMKKLLEAGVHFRTSDSPLESEDGQIHLWSPQWHLHHRFDQDLHLRQRCLQALEVDRR
jgi:hypothetical protein